MKDFSAKWRHQIRAVGVLFVAVAGLLGWRHATMYPEAWASPSGLDLSGAVQLAFLMIGALGLLGLLPALLVPWMENRIGKSPLVVTVAANELRVQGKGRHAGIRVSRLVSGEAAFSDRGHLLAHPERLSAELSSLLTSLGLQLKPSVVIKVDPSGYPDSDMVDLDAIKRVFAGCHNIYEFGYSTRPMLGSG